MMKYISHSDQETIHIGAKLGRALGPNRIVSFFGDVGAGKTTMIKGIAAELAGCSYIEVNSPTFVYLNIYEGLTTVYHFDLYRLTGSDQFLEMGFDELLYSGGVSCLEWSERINDLLPKDIVKVFISALDGCSREVSITGLGDGKNYI